VKTVVWWIVALVVIGFVVLSLRGREQSTFTSEERARYADAGRYANEDYGEYLDEKAAIERATRTAERYIRDTNQRISDLEQQVRDLKNQCVGNAWDCP
jgi:hypothetical protein